MTSKRSCKVRCIRHGAVQRGKQGRASEWLGAAAGQMSRLQCALRNSACTHIVTWQLWMCVQDFHPGTELMIVPGVGRDSAHSQDLLGQAIYRAQVQHGNLSQTSATSYWFPIFLINLRRQIDHSSSAHTQCMTPKASPHDAVQEHQVAVLVPHHALALRLRCRSRCSGRGRGGS